MTSGCLAARVFAEWIDDRSECRFAFDLIVDRVDCRICGQWPIFGATDIGGPDARPFLLEPDGRLRFGQTDRDWRTDLRGRPIKVGERFQVWWSPTDLAEYEIVKVAVLGSKAARRGLLGRAGGSG